MRDIRPRPVGRRLGTAMALMLLPGTAFAQGPAPDLGATPPAFDKGAVDPGQGGVAGTGLGKMSGKDTTGRGQSVSGPPGQGIDGMAVSKPDVHP